MIKIGETMEIYDQDGELVASINEEGLLTKKPSNKKEKEDVSERSSEQHKESTTESG